MQGDDAMRDTLEMQVVFARSGVIQKEDCGIASTEELLELENLPPVAERRFREQPHLRERIENDSRWIDPLDQLGRAHV